MLAQAMYLIIQDGQDSGNSRLEQNKHSEDFRGENSSGWGHYTLLTVAKAKGFDYKNFRLS